jgi:hypothetical protein
MNGMTQERKGMIGMIPTRDQILTQGDLQEFKEQILQDFKSIIKECIGGVPGKKWLKSAEVKKLLGISHGFLQSLRDSGVLPFSKIGGSIYYDYEDICTMMASNCILWRC